MLLDVIRPNTVLAMRNMTNSASRLSLCSVMGSIFDAKLGRKEALGTAFDQRAHRGTTPSNE
jgi:hypothetical protein